MFGHQDQVGVGRTDQNSVDDSVDAMLNDNNQGSSFPSPGGSSMAGSDTMSATDPTFSTPETTVAPQPQPIVPEDTPTSSPLIAPGLSTDTSATNDMPTTALDSPTSYSADPTNSDQTLLTLKQNALQQLRPLVDHLDQTPEEKFRTTMMMIQGADDQSLIQPAYEAAQQITDEKTRAQALLDVVNEINYFTHK